MVRTARRVAALALIFGVAAAIGWRIFTCQTCVDTATFEPWPQTFEVVASDHDEELGTSERMYYWAVIAVPRVDESDEAVRRISTHLLDRGWSVRTDGQLEHLDTGYWATVDSVRLDRVAAGLRENTKQAVQRARDGRLTAALVVVFDAS